MKIFVQVKEYSKLNEY